MIELYSAAGTFTNFGSSLTWTLVGDTANGGLATTGGWTTTIYKANVSVTTMALADGVAPRRSQQSWMKSEYAGYINYQADGTDGHFYSAATAAPYNVANRAVPGTASIPSASTATTASN